MNIKYLWVTVPLKQEPILPLLWSNMKVAFVLILCFLVLVLCYSLILVGNLLKKLK